MTSIVFYMRRKVDNLRQKSYLEARTTKNALKRIYRAVRLGKVTWEELGATEEELRLFVDQY